MNVKTALALLVLLPAALALTRPAGASTAAPPPQPGHILTDVYGGLVGYNNDGSNQINYSVQSDEDFSPSVSRDGSKIAFASRRNDPTLGHQRNTEIYVMNGDATGLRQLTFAGILASGDRTNDVNPVISPDGTKVAFVGYRSTYTYPDGHIGAFTNVWVVNTDGTNLHQVTQTQTSFSYSYGFPVYGGTSINSVVWGPDSHTIAFTGVRVSTPPGSSSSGYNNVLGMIQDDGSGETEPVVIGPGSFIGSCLDWSPNGRYLVFGYGDNAETYAALDVFDLVSGTGTSLPKNGTLNLAPGTVRFSSDSTHLLVRSGGLYSLNLDGSNTTLIPTPNDPGSGGGSAPIWAAQGAAIPKPDHLSVSPSPAYLPVGGSVHLLPTLYDAHGNVIVHAVRAWNENDTRFLSVAVDGDATAGSFGVADPYGPSTVAPDNGGVTAPASYVVVGTPKINFTIDSNTNLTYRDTPNNTIAFGVIIKDTGDGALSNMLLQTATLNGVPAISAVGSSYGQSQAGPQPLPYGIAGGFGPGVTTEVQIFFPASAALPGTRAVLKMGGTYVGGTFASTLRVTSP